MHSNEIRARGQKHPHSFILTDGTVMWAPTGLAAASGWFHRVELWVSICPRSSLVKKSEF